MSYTQCVNQEVYKMSVAYKKDIVAWANEQVGSLCEVQRNTGLLA